MNCYNVFIIECFDNADAESVCQHFWDRTASQRCPDARDKYSIRDASFFSPSEVPGLCFPAGTFFSYDNFGKFTPKYHSSSLHEPHVLLMVTLPLFWIQDEPELAA